MSNTVTITACDNELYIIAYRRDGTAAYQLAHIVSGYNYQVNVTVTITAGTYTEPPVYGGSGDLNKSYAVQLPVGGYMVAAIGINWAGPWSFAYALDGVTFSESSSTGTTGVVWTPGELVFTVGEIPGLAISTEDCSNCPPIPSSPAGLELQWIQGPNLPQCIQPSTTCQVVEYSGLTYWTFMNGRFPFLAGYDANKTVVKTVDLSPIYDMLNGPYAIVADPAAQNILLLGTLLGGRGQVNAVPIDITKL